jgi:hypothetical protein
MSMLLEKIHGVGSRLGVTLVAVCGLWLSTGSAATLGSEPHPFQNVSFGRSATEPFANPNGIAVDESTGDVYVADLGADTIYKFDANGVPVDFSALGSNALTGIDTPTNEFAFPAALPGTPAAIAVDNSTSPSDPSRGDLYVMDAGRGAIDKFSSDGKYLDQIAGYTPATGSSEHELLGVAVDGSGTVHVDVSTSPLTANKASVDELDDSVSNHMIAEQRNEKDATTGQGIPGTEPMLDGYTVNPAGDSFLLYAEPCSCTVKLGQQLAGLGELDLRGSGDVAVAVDAGSGHVYIDDQSSVTEWDTGAMNGGDGKVVPPEAVGKLVSRFGSSQLSGGGEKQGGIAVNGATGTIYVSNPVVGKGEVYVFGTDAPAVTATNAANVAAETTAPGETNQEAATLNGTVNPRGAQITSCEFEYGIANEFGQVPSERYEGKAPCEPSAIGSGTSSVPVSANVKGLALGQLYRFRLIAISGSGAGESSGLFATLSEGFGVKRFEISFINEDGSPDTQAGSHPYELVNSIEFKSHYVRKESNTDGPYLREPNGTLKQLAVDLPPGLVGNPNATTEKCQLAELRATSNPEAPGPRCPAESLVGGFAVTMSSHISDGEFFSQSLEHVYDMVTPHGVALQLGTTLAGTDLIINNGLFAGGGYPIRATIVNAPATAPVINSRLTVLGVIDGKAFLTLPTGCHGPLRSKIAVESYQGQKAEASTVTQNAAGTPVSLTGCSKLLFQPTVSVAADTTDASSSSGLTVGVHVPQTAVFNPDGLAESSLRDTTVTLPEGVAVNPSGANGLEACTSNPGALPAGALGAPGDQIGFKGFEALNPDFEAGIQTATFTPEVANPLISGVNFCPNGSKVATVKIKTPLLEHELEGAVYLAEQNANPFGSLIAMYIVAEDPISGSLVKLTGEVKLSETGQIVTTFQNTPDLPFEDLEIKFFGGERAPLSTPSRCGTYTTRAEFTPWDGNNPVSSISSFNIDHGPNGGPCPGASLPFHPELAAGTINNQAGGFSPFTMTMSREDGNQSLQSVSLKMPPGLSGVLPGVELCAERQANAGTCGPDSEIGETTISVGVGNDPFTVKGGKVFFTGPYKGAPFGLSIVNPAKAGPYDVEKDTSNPKYDPPCDCIVVRAKVEVNPLTAALTVTSDNEGQYKIPSIVDGIPLQIKHVNVTITRHDFTINPTNCEALTLTGELRGTEGATSVAQVPFQVSNCARLEFKPTFKAATSGKTSRSRGASLHVRLTYPKAPQGTQANIRSTKVSLPKQLPSRLSTLQKACPARIFNANPASCPSGSLVGSAKAITPILPVPLQGPAYFVSNGGVKFPELVLVLQGYGVTIDLHGETFINGKTNVTSSIFRAVPDAPVTSFELTLPQGPDSALAANGNLCSPIKTVFVKKKVKVRFKGRMRTVTRRVRTRVPTRLVMPTAFTAQNGAVIHRTTPISVSGCRKAKKTGAAVGKRGKKKK